MKITKSTIVSSMIILALLIVTGYATAKATKTYVSGTSYRLLFLDAPPPQTTPSGNRIINREVLWYGDSSDNRLDGYEIIVSRVILHPDSEIQAHGTHTIIEKVDNIPIADLINGNFNPDDIITGEVLWEGTWTLTGDGLIHGVIHNGDGLKVFYEFTPVGSKSSSTWEGYILDPHGE